MNTTANTATTDHTVELTLEAIQEAVALVKALATPEAPSNLFVMQLPKGVNIWKAEHMPRGTIAVSKDIFDLIFAASAQNTSEHSKETK